MCSVYMGIFERCLSATLTESTSYVMLSWSDYQSDGLARRHGMRQSVCLKGFHRNGEGIPC